MGLKANLRDTRRAWGEQCTLYLVFCAIAFGFGDLLFGIDTGSFGSIQALPAFLKDFAPLTPTGTHAFSTGDRSLMNSLVFPGKLLGTFVFEPLVARYGYKITMWVVLFFQSIAVIIQLTSSSWQIFMGGRIIAYFAVGIVENVVPSYLSEIAPPSLRGFFAGIVNLVVNLGNLWGVGMGRAYATEMGRIGWMVPVAVQLIPVAAIAIMLPFVVESPRWLINKNQKDRGLEALNKLRPKRDVDTGLTMMEAETIDQAIVFSRAQEQGRWTELLQGTYLNRTLVCCLLFTMNQCTGLQFINLYAPTFLTSMGLTQMAFTYTTIITAVGIIAGLIAITCLDVIGRRRILLFGVSLLGVFNAVCGGVGSKSSISNGDIQVIVAALCFISIGNRAGTGPVAWVCGSEIGGVKMRKKILAVGAAWDVVMAFVMSYSIPYLIGSPGANLKAKVGFFFMGICVLCGIVSFLFVPELTGRSLEEVDELYDSKIWAWQFEKAQTTGLGRAQFDRGSQAALDDVELGKEGEKDAKVGVEPVILK